MQNLKRLPPQQFLGNPLQTVNMYWYFPHNPKASIYHQLTEKDPKPHIIFYNFSMFTINEKQESYFMQDWCVPKLSPCQNLKTRWLWCTNLPSAFFSVKWKIKWMGAVVNAVNSICAVFFRYSSTIVWVIYLLIICQSDVIKYHAPSWVSCK